MIAPAYREGVSRTKCRQGPWESPPPISLGWGNGVGSGEALWRVPRQSPRAGRAPGGRPESALEIYGSSPSSLQPTAEPIVRVRVPPEAREVG